MAAQNKYTLLPFEFRCHIYSNIENPRANYIQAIS